MTDGMNTPTSVSEWKKASGSQAMPTKVPSGKTALIRVPGVDVFFKAGMVPNSLQGIINKAISSGSMPDPEALAKKTEGNPEMLRDIMRLAEKITCYCVVEPNVHDTEYTDQDLMMGICSVDEVGTAIPFAKRDPNTLYVDEVDLEDRMFIFQLAFGGTRDLERFRDQLEGNVELISPQSKPKSAAKRPSRAGK